MSSAHDSLGDDANRPDAAPGSDLTAGIPITSFDDEDLGRTEFIRALANRIRGYRSPESIIVGLYGPWGTGKTSLLNLASIDLSSGDNPCIIVKFNPWYFPDEHHLYGQFFKSLLSRLGKPDLADSYRSASDLIQSLATALNSFGALPGVGVVATAVQALGKALGSQAKHLADLETLKSKISAELKRHKKKIVVVIDDIDRLTDAEIRLMFKLIKAVADFENVIYVLAFDRGRVAQALRSNPGVSKDDSGNLYIEKIVNFPVDLPPIRRTKLYELLTRRLNAYLQLAGAPSGDTSRLQTIATLIHPVFKTLRILDRYINVLTFAGSLVGIEIDHADLIGITAIQVAAPELYARIRDNKDLCVDTPEGKLFHRSDKDRQEDKKQVEAIFSELEISSAVQELVGALFPRIDSLFGTKSYSDSQLDEWGKQRRICSADCFDIYFQLSVEPGDVSNAQLRIYFARIGEGDFASVMDEVVSKGNAISFLERLADSLDDPNIIARRVEVVRQLLDSSDRFSEDLSGFPIRLDGQTLTMQLVYRMLRQLPAEADRFNFLRDYFKKADTSLSGIVKQVSIESAEHGRLGGRLDVSKQLVSDDDLTVLEGLAVGLIRRWAENGKLADHRGLPYMLYHWAKWAGDRVATQNYVLNKLDDTNFVRWAVSQAADTAFMRGQTNKLDPAKVNDIADFKLVSERLARIETDPRYLDDESKKQLSWLLGKEPA